MEQRDIHELGIEQRFLLVKGGREHMVSERTKDTTFCELIDSGARWGQPRACSKKVWVVARG